MAGTLLNLGPKVELFDGVRSATAVTAECDAGHRVEQATKIDEMPFLARLFGLLLLHLDDVVVGIAIDEFD